MATPLVVAPAAAALVRVGMQVGSSALAIEIIGGSVIAASTGTLILATGGAAAVVLAGVGICNYLSKP
jgi:hypothetical protein